MQYDKFIKPEEVEIGGRVFALSLINSIDALPIYNEVAKAIQDNGVIGMTMLPTATVKAILQFVALNNDGEWEVPDSDIRVNRIFSEHPGCLQEVVIRMVKKNFSFFVTGDLLDLLVDKVEATASV